MSSQRVVLSPPELCWARWALRGRSGGAPETSQGRSGVSLGALGELSGPSGDTPGTPESVFFEFCSDFGGVLGGGIDMNTFLDGFCVYFSLFFGGFIVCLSLNVARIWELEGKTRHPRI